MKLNKHAVVFIIIFLIIGAGFSTQYWSDIGTVITNTITDSTLSQNNRITKCIRSIDTISSKNISYYTILLDIHSLQNNLLQNKIIKKDYSTIVKTNSNSLTETKARFSEEELQKVSNRIETLYDATKKQNANFLYVAIPAKNYVTTPPCNVNDYTAENFDRFITNLESRGIPCLNLAEKMDSAGLLNDQSYFKTDHHWKPEIGFWASGMICETLRENYGFNYDEAFTDLTNYNIQTYEDWFLGSYGKKTGRLFTFEGAEDFHLITPSFKTDFTQEQPLKNSITTGSFEEVLLNKDFVETKDVYKYNTYATYTGGDFRLQIIKNNLNTNGKTIVMLRDSFACTVSPFLALNAAELHLIDTRNFIPHDNIDVYDYIEQVNPDYVLVMYQDLNPIENASNQYHYSVK